MFEQTFRNLDDVLGKEAGCATELDCTEQTPWILFLKHLDDVEQERAMEAELRGHSCQFILDEAHRRSTWAAPRKADGSFDPDRALTGDGLGRMRFRDILRGQGFAKDETGQRSIMMHGGYRA